MRKRPRPAARPPDASLHALLSEPMSVDGGGVLMSDPDSLSSVEMRSADGVGGVEGEDEGDF